MPVVLRWNGHRFLFYSKEVGEPPHIHIIKDNRQLKIWLADMRIARNKGFTAHEINQLVKITAQNREKFLEAWNDFFGN